MNLSLVLGDSGGMCLLYVDELNLSQLDSSEESGQSIMLSHRFVILIQFPLLQVNSFRSHPEKTRFLVGGPGQLSLVTFHTLKPIGYSRVSL